VVQELFHWVIPLFRAACWPLPAELVFSIMIVVFSLWKIRKSDNFNAAMLHVKQQTQKK